MSHPRHLALALTLCLALPLAAAPLRVAADTPFAALQAACDAQLAQAFPSFERFAAAVRAPAGHPGFALLAAYGLLRAVGAPGYAAVRDLPDGPAFLTAFLNDQGWVEELLDNGPSDYAKALHALYLLWKHERESLKTPLYRRLATAFALQQNGASDYNLVTGFRLYVRNHRDLKLHANFDGLPVYAMRYATEAGDPADIEYQSKTWNLPLGAYYGTCWSCAYRLDCDYGENIQGGSFGGYHSPWRWKLGYQENSRLNGGVCGTLSTYGAYSARVHGVPSVTAGQPGHCAYVIRGWDGQWGIAYNVDWPTSVGAFWGGQFTFLQLIEDLYGRHASQVVPAQRAAWYAQWLRDRAERSGPHCVGDWQHAVYRLGRFVDPAKTQPERTATLAGFSFADLRSLGGACSIYRGELEVPAATTTTFSLRSDDGSRLVLDDQEVLAANCTAVSKAVALTKGRHSVRVEHYDSGGAHYLNVDLVQPYNPEVAAAYHLATELHPGHYSLWREQQSYLLGAGADVPTRRTFALALADGMVQHQEAAWAALCDANLYTGLTPAERAALLLDLHRTLQETKVAQYVDYPYQGYLGAQFNLLGGDPALRLSYFGDLLKLHAGSNRYFAWLVDWGNKTFAQDPKQVTAYGQLLTDVLGGTQDGGRRNLLLGFYKTAATKASRDADPKALAQLVAGAARLFPAETDGWGPRYLDARSAKGYPAVVPGTEKLLSAGGTLQQSSASQWDRPLLVPALLGDPAQGGFLQTNAEEHPWAQVTLPGEALVNTVVLVTRFENAGERAGSFPLKVSVSTDGRKWTVVQTVDVGAPQVRVDLSAQPARARYVRVEGEHAGKPALLVLRNLLVYAKPLY